MPERAIPPLAGGLAVRPSYEAPMNTVQMVAAATAPASAPSRRAGLLRTGIASGLLGGAAMAVFVLLAAAAAGMDPLLPMKAIGATFVGPEALRAGAGIVAWGVLLHAATSAAFGVLFVALFPLDLRPLGAGVLGAGYAMFVLGVMAAGVAPAVNAHFRAAAQPMGGSWVVAHVIFGCALGLSAARLARRRAAAGGLDPGSTRGA